jgi:hypothetical protein
MLLVLFLRGVIVRIARISIRPFFGFQVYTGRLR